LFYRRRKQAREKTEKQKREESMTANDAHHVFKSIIGSYQDEHISYNAIVCACLLKHADDDNFVAKFLFQNNERMC
jgi:hypothetical protein